MTKTIKDVIQKQKFLNNFLNSNKLNDEELYISIFFSTKLLRKTFYITHTIFL